MIRSVLLYIILVGIPVIALGGVLNLGQRLTPPASFGGSWRVEVWPDSGCSVSGPDSLHLVIEQSGPSLRIRSSMGGPLEGRVVGEGFVAQGRNGQGIQGNRIGGQAGSLFEGTLVGDPCGATIPTRIRATRLQLPGDLSGH